MLTLNKYTKAIVMALVPLITALGLYQQTGKIDAPEISLLILGLLGALVVAVTRNLPSGWRRFSKFLVSACSALVPALVTAFVTGDWSAAEWTTLLTGLLTACLVWFVENSDTAVGVKKE